MKGHTMKKASYKIRFNPKTTVKAINSTLDAITKRLTPAP